MVCLFLGKVLEQQGDARKNTLLGKGLGWRFGELGITDRIELAVYAGCPLHRGLAYFTGSDFAAADKISESGCIITEVLGLLHGRFHLLF